MKKILYILLATIFITSCYKDKGNYNYTEIDDITIDNVPNNIGDLILFEDTIRINPNVGPKADFDANNFEYKWLKKEGFGSSAKLVVISENLELVYPVIESGNIMLMLEVKHKQTGIAKRITITANGTSKMSNGIYLLKETTEGNTEIDMISFNNQSGEVNLFSNLLTPLLGDGLEGNPITIDYWGYRVEDFENARLVAVPAIRVASKNDLVIINTDEFKVLAGFEDMFVGDIPQERNIQALKTIGKAAILINNNKVHCCKSYYNELVNGEFKEQGYNRYQAPLEGDYSMSSYVTWPPRGEGPFLCYDMNSGLFKKIDESYSEPMNINNKDFQKDFKSDLLFMEHIGTGIYGTNTYALMKKRSYPDSLLLIDMETSSLVNSYVKLMKKDVLMAEDYLIDNASIWCVHQYHRIIYFAVDDKVYKYDTGNRTEELLLDFKGETISQLDVVSEYYLVDGALPIHTEHTKMIVSTVSGNSYNLYKYNMNGMVPEKEPDFTISGEGKIKKYLYIKPEICPVNWMKTYN